MTPILQNSGARRCSVALGEKPIGNPRPLAERVVDAEFLDLTVDRSIKSSIKLTEEKDHQDESKKGRRFLGMRRRGLPATDNTVGNEI